MKHIRLAVVIPAYNEEKNLGNVLKTLCNIDIIDEIIVVSDGSVDNTVAVAKSFNVKVIELKENQGKSNAVLTGVENTSADIILMLDADLIGLSKEHIEQLIRPIISENIDMTIGVFKNGRKATDLAQTIAPFLSGQRAIKRDVFDKLKDYNFKDYGIEIALTLMSQRENISVKEVYLTDVTHIMKEEKRGFFLGFSLRMKMYWDIILFLIKFKLRCIKCL